MINPAEHDYTLYHGAEFLATFTLYSDARQKRWRGLFNEEWDYLPGDVVQAEDDTAWVCAERVQFTGPLTAGQSQWSPLERQNLEGWTLQLICEGVFTASPTIEAAEGVANVSVPPTEFAAAPGSAHYYLEATDPGGIVSYPLRGTMIFRKP